MHKIIRLAEDQRDMTSDHTPLRIIIFGVGQNAEIAFHYMQFGELTTRLFEVVAFTGDRSFLPTGGLFLDLPVIPFEEKALSDFCSKFSLDPPQIFIPISFSNGNSLRSTKFQTAESWGMTIATFVHPLARISTGVKIGRNCLLGDLTWVGIGTTIGDDTIIRPLTHIGQNCQIGQHCWISAGATLGDNVTVGDYSFVGAGAKIQSGVNIGDENIIALGANITADTYTKQCFLTGLNKLAEPSFKPKI